MADIVDLANEYADEFLQRALEQRRREASIAVSAEFCVDCGDAIPILRQQATQGCETCVTCKEFRERRG